MLSNFDSSRPKFGFVLGCGAALLFFLRCTGPAADVASIKRYGVFEAVFGASTAAGNPYVDIEAEAVIRRPDGETWRIPLFWDGNETWKLRVSPDSEGKWAYVIESEDVGLNGRDGEFVCIPSGRAGGLRAMPERPSHFARQNGDPVWFMADTAWGYFTDSDEDNHHRRQVEHYATTRAKQGFNAIHSMMMSEQGVGNNGGLPFENMADETINPAYWQEVDERLAFANDQGLAVGLALAWADKRKIEPFAWRRFPNVEARKRYARYVAARYSAHDVYFLVSGEWHGEVRTRENVTEQEVFDELVELGRALDSADPHGRMIGIHPMTQMGSVREFADVEWMSFADYQQNYQDLHKKVLLSSRLDGPVVNSEYGYHLRDKDGDGKPDKSNSFSAEDMRFASWDIVTAGGYLVTGFGSTYFAGHREPGPFDVDAAKNDDWEAQIGYIQQFFEAREWWKLIPADELISSHQPRTADREIEVTGGRSMWRPPQTTYWAMTAPGAEYVIYVRGLREPVRLALDARPGTFRVLQLNPRTGESAELEAVRVSTVYEYAPPDEQDWVVLLDRVDSDR